MRGPGFEISLDKTSQHYPCSADDTLLRAGLRAGLNLPYECNVGQCGSCKIQLLEGDVASIPQAPTVLSQRDQERGRRLACQSFPRSDCRIRFLGGGPDLETPSVAPQRFEAILTSCRDLTHDMREFRFQADALAQFQPGQYALLDLNGVTGSRAYSMSNLANERGEWHFIIRKVPGGAGSGYLFDAKPGERMRLDAPYGRAFLREASPRGVCCVAGGSGLAPMLSIARAFASNRNYDASSLQFLYGGRTAADICGVSELQELSGFGQRIFFHAATSEPQDIPSPYKQQFVHELLIEKLGDSLENFDFYCAGPPKMIEALTSALQENKIGKDRVRYDRFF